MVRKVTIKDYNGILSPKNVNAWLNDNITIDNSFPSKLAFRLSILNKFFAKNLAPYKYAYVLGCPKSIFLSQTCFLQQCTFVQT